MRGEGESSMKELKSLRSEASGYKFYDRTDGATEYLFEGLTVGNKDKFKVCGVNDTNVGPFSPEVEVTVT